MTIQEAKSLLRRIKKAIQYENNHAHWQRVQWLKVKRQQIKTKIKITLTKPNENLANN